MNSAAVQRRLTMEEKILVNDQNSEKNANRLRFLDFEKKVIFFYRSSDWQDCFTIFLS